MAKPARKIKRKELEAVETEPDAWERFTKTVGKIIPAKRPKAKKEAQSNSGMLTPSEIESLRRGAKETSAFAKKAFAHLRPKSEKETPAK